MIEYYISPHAGSDTNAGTTKSAPWKSFTPLQAIRLQPGDRIEVLEPGRFDSSCIIQGEGTPHQPIQLQLAPGRYDFHTNNLTKRCYHISNNNDAPSTPKNIGVLITNAKHFVFQGNGARLVCRGKMIPLCMDRSESITITNLKIDYHRPTVSEFSVLATTTEHADISVHPDSTYELRDGQIIWLGEGWRYNTGLAQELIPATGQIWRRQDPLLDMHLEALGPELIRAHGAHTMTAGHVYQLRDTTRDCVGIFMQNSKSLNLENLDLYFLHGMGIVGQFSEDITLDHIHMTPEASSGRTCSVWADATHFSGCRGHITYRDCIFDGTHDDAINVHGTYLQIQELRSENVVRLRFMHRQTFGLMAFHPGDEVDFVRWDSMEIFSSNQVANVQMTDPYEMLVTFDSPLPFGTRLKDVIENVTWTPSVTITGCTTKRIPTRGFLLTTRRRVVVKDNDFLRINSGGINIDSDTSNWYESGCVRDMEITNNRFVKCGGEAILINPRHSIANPAIHRNIRITGNAFMIPAKASAIKAVGTSELVFSDNRIELDTDRLKDDIILTNDCGAVTISNNHFSQPPQEDPHANPTL